MIQLTFSINGGLSSNIPAGGFTDVEHEFLDIAATGSPVTIIDISDLGSVTDGLAIALDGIKDRPVTASPESLVTTIGDLIRATGAMGVYRVPPNSEFTGDGLKYVVAISRLFAGMAKNKLFRYSHSELPRPVRVSTEADPWFTNFSIHGRYLYLYRA